MKTKTTTLDASAVLCFAINNFGDGDHPYAQATSLPYFLPAYVKQCLVRMSQDERVQSDVRAFAWKLTPKKIKQLLDDLPLVDTARVEKTVSAARAAVAEACPWSDANDAELRVDLFYDDENDVEQLEASNVTLASCFPDDEDGEIERIASELHEHGVAHFGGGASPLYRFKFAQKGAR